MRKIIAFTCAGWRQTLFKNVKERQALKFVKAKQQKSGKVTLTYSTTV